MAEHRNFLFFCAIVLLYGLSLLLFFYSAPMRKLLIIPAILLALYALAGFLVFPFALKFFGQRALQEKFGAAAKVERVQGNPFTWELSVEGVSFADLEGVWSVQCDRASVDLSARTVLEF